MGKNKKSRGQNSLEDGTSSSFPSQSHLRSHLQPEGPVPEDDNYVWKLPGFNICEFYAAAEYLRKQEKNQGLRPANRSQTSTNVKTTDVEEAMLDKLALLFARVKSGGKSPMHVTATALKKGKAGYEIWIAKNDGPKNDGQGLDDQQFKTDLQDWFKTKGAWGTDATLMDRDFRYFWRDRLEHYLRKIRESWDALCRGLKTSASDGDAKVPKAGRKARAAPASAEGDEEKHAGLMVSHDALAKLYQDEMADDKRFDQDWNDVKNICSNQDRLRTILDGPCSTPIPSDIERQSYTITELDQPSNHLDLAREFSRLLKAIRLLTTVERAIEAFIAFRERLPPNTKVDLKFLVPPNDLHLGQEMCIAFANTLTRWRAPKNNPVFDKEVEEIETLLRRRKQFLRYFHCELQIINAFLGDVEVCDYIGCSKLSCYMCWGVLQGTAFRIRDTHANLWPACAFPFSTKGANGAMKYELLLALKRTHDLVVEKVLRRALDSSFKFSDGASLAETEPGGELKHRRRTRKITREVEGRPGQFETIFRTRAVCIPVDGPPVSQVIDCRIGYSDEVDDLVPVPLKWSSMPAVKEVFTEQRGDARHSIVVCAQQLRSSRQARTAPIPKINEWYRQLIFTFHQFLFDDNRHTSCKWRGDLCAIRLIIPAKTWSRAAEIDAIDKNELQDAVQKCRDGMASKLELVSMPPNMHTRGGMSAGM